MRALRDLASASARGKTNEVSTTTFKVDQPPFTERSQLCSHVRALLTRPQRVELTEHPFVAPPVWYKPGAPLESLQLFQTDQNSLGLTAGFNHHSFIAIGHLIQESRQVSLEPSNAYVHAQYHLFGHFTTLKPG